MDTFGVTIGFITAILGIAYPIITQIAIDDKFSSETILDLYDNNIWKKRFKFFLVFSLLIIPIYLYRFQREIDLKNSFLNNIVENSASLILGLISIMLIYSFFKLIEIIKLFNRSTRLLAFLVKHNVESLKSNDFTYFNALSDLSLWAIENQDSTISKELSRHFYELFSEYRKNSKTTNKGVIYPQQYYFLTYNLGEKLVNFEKNTLLFLDNRIFGGIWLIGEYDKIKISEETYNFQWQILRMAMKHNRGDLVYEYWKTANTYIQHGIEKVSEEYEYIEDKLSVRNREQLIEYEKELDRFLEFNYALGGLILYYNDIKLLNKIFDYTTSDPPSRPLLPIHMTQVFDAFYKFLDPHDRNFTWISHQYSFPELDSTSDLRKINYWICKYIGVLYLRQFNIEISYTYDRPKDLPAIPSDIATKRFRKKYLTDFKTIVEELISDIELLRKLKFKPNG